MDIWDTFFFFTFWVKVAPHQQHRTCVKCLNLYCLGANTGLPGWSTVQYVIQGQGRQIPQYSPTYGFNLDGVTMCIVEFRGLLESDHSVIFYPFTMSLRTDVFFSGDYLLSKLHIRAIDHWPIMLVQTQNAFKAPWRPGALDGRNSQAGKIANYVTIRDMVTGVVPLDSGDVLQSDHVPQ